MNPDNRAKTAKFAAKARTPEKRKLVRCVK